MRLDVDILNESMDLIGMRADVVMQRLFERLFQLDPKLENYFRPEILPELRINIIQTLLVVIRFGDKPIYLTRFLQTLGEKHSRFNLTTRNYESFAQALLLSLEEELGDDWNADCKNAWCDMIELISSLMQTSTNIQSPRAIKQYSFAGTVDDEPASQIDYSDNAFEAKLDVVQPESSISLDETSESRDSLDFESLLNQLPLNVIIVNDELEVLFENQNSQLAWLRLKNQFNAAESLKGKSRAEVFFSSEYGNCLPVSRNVKYQIGSLTLSLNVSQFGNAESEECGWICIWDVVK